MTKRKGTPVTHLLEIKYNDDCARCKHADTQGAAGSINLEEQPGYTAEENQK